MKPTVNIASVQVGPSTEDHVFIVAELSANHLGHYENAERLLLAAKEAGADVAKFQHFTADRIVSDVGFSDDKVGKVSHQAGWRRSVSEMRILRFR